MLDDRPPSSLRDQIAALRRRRWIVVVCLFAVLGVALGFSLLQTPQYAATAEVAIPVNPRYATQLVESNGAVRNQDAKRLLQNQVQYLESAVISSKAAEKLGFTPKISARALPDADVIEIRAEYADPDKAALIANTVAEVYVSQRTADSVDSFDKVRTVVERKIAEANDTIADLDRQIAALSESQRLTQTARDLDARRAEANTKRESLTKSLDDIALSTDLAGGEAPQVINPATAPASPFQPTTRRNLLIGGALGLALGLGLAVLIDHLDDSIRTKDELDRATGLITLASIPRSTVWRNESEAVLHYLSDPSSPTSEGYRSLRTAIQYVNLTSPIKTLLVTSALPGEGKTTTAANLAVAFAASGLRVVVVSCDLRRPRLHDFFHVDGEVGLTSLLRNEVTLDAIMQDRPKPRHVLVIPSGPAPPNPSELLATTAAQELLQEIADRVDLLVIDAPPVLPVTDASVLAKYVDATLFVSRAAVSTRATVGRAVEQLTQSGAPLVGTVLIGANDESGMGYAYQRYSSRTSRPSRRSRATEPVPATNR